MLIFIVLFFNFQFAFFEACIGTLVGLSMHTVKDDKVQLEDIEVVFKNYSMNGSNPKRETGIHSLPEGSSHLNLKTYSLSY